MTTVQACLLSQQVIKSNNMDKSTKFVLPSPIFEKNAPPKMQPHYLTPSGMTLLPHGKQPPAMYGPKGSTVPPKYLKQGIESKPPEEPAKPKPFCEACEMELQSIDDLRWHRSQHERCPVDGCKFKGHPNVMDKHVTALHSSGLFEKIKKISTPEEIAAWREERRKKYPTLANAKMRQLAQEQRERRGERLGENKARFGRQEDRKRARANNNKVDNEGVGHPKRLRNIESNHKKGKDKNNRTTSFRNPVEGKDQRKKPEDPKKPITAEIDEIVVCGIKMFRGTSNLKDYKHEKTKSEKIQNTLVSLVGMYGSDDDEDDGSETESSTNQGDEKHENVLPESVKIESLEDSRSVNGHENHFDQSCDTEESIIQALHENSATVFGKDQTSTHAEDNLPDQQVVDRKTETGTGEHQFIDNNNTKTTKSSDEQETHEILNCTVDSSGTEISIGIIKENAEEPINSSVIEETKAANLNESSDEGPEEAPIQRTTTMPLIEPSTSSEVLNNTQTESIEAKRLRIEELRKKRIQQASFNLNIRKRKLRKQNTMLEKLLEPEIRHERNVLLQCVRFVCENNFFGIGEPVRNKEQTEKETFS